MSAVPPARRLVTGCLALLVALGLTACEAGSADRPGGNPPSPPGSLDVALSEPVEDELYPDVGDPGVPE